MELTTSIQIKNLLELNINPASTIEYVFWLKARIKALEEEAKQYEEVMVELIKHYGGKYTAEIDNLKGNITLCATKTYKFSDQVERMEQEKKQMEARIKAKKLIEMASGAEVKSETNYLRYNINI